METKAPDADGGGDAGFVLSRSAGTIEDEDRGGLTDSQRKVLDHIRETGPRGATWKELLETLNGVKGTLSRALNELTRWNRITKRNGRYHTAGPVEPESGQDTPNAGGSTRFQRGSTEPMEPGKNADGSTGSTTLRGGTVEPFAGTPAITPREGVPTELPDDPQKIAPLVRAAFEEGSPRGPIKNLPHYLDGATTLGVLTNSVRAAMGRGYSPEEFPADERRYWERIVGAVAEERRNGNGGEE